MNDNLTLKGSDFRAELRSNFEGSLSYYDDASKIYSQCDPFTPGTLSYCGEPYSLISEAATVSKSFEEQLDEVIKKAVREAIEETEAIVKPLILKYKLKYR